jgi:hypothetical protein
MTKKHMLRWLLAFGLFLGVIIICGGILTSRALADCGTPPKSSCITCHAVDGHVTAMGDWNKVHLNQDMCTSCHGGNGSTMDKNLAHASMVAQPLNDVYTDCHSCHPADYISRSDQFAATLNVTPESCATPTAIAAYGDSGGSHIGGNILSFNTSSDISTWKPIAMISGALACVAFLFLVLNWLNNRRIKS